MLSKFFFFIIFLQRYHWDRGKANKYFQKPCGVYNVRLTREELPKDAPQTRAATSPLLAWLCCAPVYHIRKSSRTCVRRSQRRILLPCRLCGKG